MDDRPLKVEVFPVRERGGQHVYPEPMWVKVTDEATGLSAACCSERSQHRNRAVALAMLEYGAAELGLTLAAPPPLSEG
jgi:protein subunit release factor A